MPDGDTLVLGGLVGLVGVASYVAYNRKLEEEEEEYRPPDPYRKYQRDHGYSPIPEEDRPLFGPEYRPLFGPEYRGPEFDWNNPVPENPRRPRRPRSRYRIPELEEPYVHRLRIGEEEPLPEFDDPDIERLRIGEDEEAKEERRQRYWERQREEAKNRRRRRARVKGVLESIYSGVGTIIDGTLSTLDYLLLTVFRRDVSTTKKVSSYLLEYDLSYKKKRRQCKLGLTS